MLLILIYSISLNVLLAAATDSSQKFLHDQGTDKNYRSPSNSRVATNHNPIINNFTYIDRTENIVRVPNLKNVYDEHKNKKKNIKKSPKRTIQKIIKKNNRSRRKMYLNQATSLPTKAPTNFNDLDKFYAQEEMSQRSENFTTQQQVNQNKKKKKWNTKTARYPMPFQNLASRKDHYRRNKRSDDREDVFILTDLDEIEFLNNDTDDNVVQAHMKKYW